MGVTILNFNIVKVFLEIRWCGKRYGHCCGYILGPLLNLNILGGHFENQILKPALIQTKTSINLF